MLHAVRQIVANDSNPSVVRNVERLSLDLLQGDKANKKDDNRSCKTTHKKSL